MKELKFSIWWKKYERFIKAFVMMFLPLLCCIMYCAADGKWIGEVYLPTSEWNDELFYYKQVESILGHGYPQGFFGFNESHALKLSFAAWSPVLVFPWIVWGLIWGWNFMAPIYCNIFIMGLAVFIFVYMLKPTWKQLLMLALMFASFTPLTRFMLSVMPETICFSAVVIMLSFAFSYVNNKKIWKLGLMFVLGAFMTLMRPYLIMFLIFPIFFSVKAHKVKGCIASLLVLAVTGVSYAWIFNNLSAAYFAPLFDTTWFEKFFVAGIWEGIKYVLLRSFKVGLEVIGTAIQGLTSDFYVGKQFCAFLLVFVILCIQAVADWRKKRWNQLQLHLPLAICHLAMLEAILLMYKLGEGGRHLLTYIAGSIFVISIMEAKFYRKAIFTAVIFAYLFLIMEPDANSSGIPYYSEACASEITDLQETLSTELTLNETNVPNYDNVIIWTLSEGDASNFTAMNWRMLYAVPAGWGISCCKDDYISENIDCLKSKYLSVIEGGYLEELCIEKAFRELGRGGGIVVYELR